LLKSETGEVDTADLAAELVLQHGRLNSLAYANAACVISDYCRTGGENNRNSTGLPVQASR
jgi:hypothetical protein|tara:strand:+ start:1819 stop:2001 length:183 start_codon:yes stop_codon:yes gene_type:complete